MSILATDYFNQVLKNFFEFTGKYWQISIPFILFIVCLIVIFSLGKYDDIKPKLEEDTKNMTLNLLKSYEVLVHDYEQLLETKDSKEWSLLRFHIIELKRIIDKRMEELK